MRASNGKPLILIRLLLGVAIATSNILPLVPARFTSAEESALNRTDVDRSSSSTTPVIIHIDRVDNLVIHGSEILADRVPPVSRGAFAPWDRAASEGGSLRIHTASPFSLSQSVDENSAWPGLASFEFLQPPIGEQPPSEPPPANEPLIEPAMISQEPISVESSLLGELDRALQRAEASSAPNAMGVDFSVQSSAVDTVQVTRDSWTVGSVSGIRRSQVSIQPVIRGYHQQQIYAQYQGENFVSVRYDLDSLLGSIDPGIIDNLIIIPGPYGVKYGPGLAFIDLVPKATPRYDEPQWHSRTQTTYQSNGQQWYGRETISGGGEFYGLRATYGHKTGNDYLSGDGTQIPASYNVRDADISLGVDVTWDTTVDFEYLRQDLTNTEYAGLMFDVRFRKTDAFFVRLHDTDWLAGELLAEAWYNRSAIAGDNQRSSKQLFYRNNFFFTSGGQTQFPQIGFVGVFDADVADTGFRLSPSWESSNGDKLTTGVDLHHVRQELNEFDNLTNRALLFTPAGFENFPIPKSESWDPGIFAELETPLRPDLKLTTGARIDWIHTSADPFHRALDPDGLIRPIFAPGGAPVARLDEDLFRTGLVKNDVLWHAFAAAEQQLDENLEVRLGFGHGQRPPSLTERYAYVPFLAVLQSAENAPFGRPDLKPEKASQGDLALSGRYEDYRFRAAVFGAYVQDYISYAYLPPPTDPASEYLTFTNISAFLSGCEFAGDFDLTDWWQPFANLSYVAGQNLSADEPLAGIYPLQSRVGLRLHEPTEDRYGVELSASFVAQQTRVARSLLEPETAGFTVVYVRGYWQVSEHLRLQSGIENLADRNYLEHLSVHDPAVYEPGFNFYLSGQMDY